MQKQVGALASAFDDVVGQTKFKNLGQHIEENIKLQYQKEILKKVCYLHNII